MSSTSPIGNRGSVPEATSVLVFAIVAGLLWYALARTGGEVMAGASSPEVLRMENAPIGPVPPTSAVASDKRP